MSKNYELLRQASWRQEYFEGLPTDPNPAPARSSSAVPRQRKRPSVPNDQVSMLVRKVFLDPQGAHNRIVMFSGGRRKAGCTWTCAHAAKTLASHVEGRVCVVDANFEAPSLHEFFSAAPAPGFSDAICESMPLKQYAVQIGRSNLWLLPAGNQCRRITSFASELSLESHLKELASDFEYLVLDVPAASSKPFVAVLGKAADGVVLVLDSSGTAPADLLQARKLLASTHVPLFGVVLNQQASPLPALLDRLMK